MYLVPYRKCPRRIYFALLSLISLNMSGCVQTFNVKDGDKDKNNKLTFFRIDNDNLLDKNKTIRTKSLMIDIQKPK